MKSQNLEIKMIATIIYYVGISFRKTNKFLPDPGRFYYESVNMWYHRMSKVFTTSRDILDIVKFV